MKLLKGLFLLFLVVLSYGSTDASVKSEGRIVGGFEIPLSEAPYQVSLLYMKSHICGGSIISKNFVLTACHCTYGRTASTLSVRVGSHVKNEGGEIFQVYIVRNHPYYNRFTFDFDYAMLHLKTSIIFDGTTKAPIALPALNAVIDDGLYVLITGWGSTQSYMESNRLLRGVILTTFNQQQCDQIYRYDGGITKQMVCALTPEKDSCSGDSGGPMVDLNTNTLIGIVSFGMDPCADPSYPGVYSRVAVVRSWIKSYSRV